MLSVGVSFSVVSIDHGFGLDRRFAFDFLSNSNFGFNLFSCRLSIWVLIPAAGSLSFWLSLSISFLVLNSISTVSWYGRRRWHWISIFVTALIAIVVAMQMSLVLMLGDV